LAAASFIQIPYSRRILRLLAKWHSVDGAWELLSLAAADRCLAIEANAVIKPPKG
jgi:hypothetical protein